MKLSVEVGLCLRQIVLNGDPAPLLKSCTAPSHQKKFGHVCCGQTAGWIKMQLGRKVGLSHGHIVLDGDPPSLTQRCTTPNFRPMSIVATRSPITATAEHLFTFLEVKVQILLHTIQNTRYEIQNTKYTILLYSTMKSNNAMKLINAFINYAFWGR